MPGPRVGDGGGVHPGWWKGLELKERRTASPRMCTALHSLPRLVPAVVIAHTGFLYPTPILRMGKLRSAQGTDRYASYQEASAEDDTVFLLQPPGAGASCIRDGAPAGCGVWVFPPHLPPHPTRAQAFCSCPWVAPSALLAPACNWKPSSLGTFPGELGSAY